MVNHVRTHLLNITRAGSQNAAGEEYISPRYVEKDLSSAARRIYGLLFGTDPERLFLNYRCRQLMRVIHASELQDHVVLEDSRLTYLPFPDTDVDFIGVFTRTVEANLPTTNLATVSGTYSGLGNVGRLTQVWQVDVDAANITIVQRRPPFQSVTYVRSDVVNDPSIAMLPGSSLRIRFPSGVTTGDRWTVTDVARPEDNLATVLSAATNAVGNLVEQVFPVTAEEPLKTWTTIWRTQTDGPLRYAAFLLAFSKYISQQPQKRT